MGTLLGVGIPVVSMAIAYWAGWWSLARRVHEELDRYYGGLAQGMRPDSLPAVLRRILK